MSSERRRHEFVKMRGPHGKGFAEMAVARVASCGFETPMSEGGYDMSMSLDVSFSLADKQAQRNKVPGRVREYTTDVRHEPLQPLDELLVETPSDDAWTAAVRNADVPTSGSEPTVAERLRQRQPRFGPGGPKCHRR